MTDSEVKFISFQFSFARDKKEQNENSVRKYILFFCLSHKRKTERNETTRRSSSSRIRQKEDDDDDDDERMKNEDDETILNKQPPQTTTTKCNHQKKNILFCAKRGDDGRCGRRHLFVRVVVIDVDDLVLMMMLYMFGWDETQESWQFNLIKIARISTKARYKRKMKKAACVRCKCSFFISDQDD